eukprot:jgi/Botrbrau1/18587/Bobra.0367s0029.1
MVMVSRIYVGGLPPDVTAEQIKRRFETFGKVLSIDLPQPKAHDQEHNADSSHRGFGYVNLVPLDDAAVRRCIGSYNGCKWRGSVLRVEEAKPSYVQRLNQEWELERSGTLTGKAPKAGRKASKAQPLLPFSGKPLHVARRDGKKTMKVEEGRPKRYFPPARPIPLDKLPWVLEDPPHAARRLAALSFPGATLHSSAPHIPFGADLARQTPKPADRNAERPARHPAAGRHGKTEGTAAAGEQKDGKRKQGERSARRALKSILGPDDSAPDDSPTEVDQDAAVDFTTPEDGGFPEPPSLVELSRFDSDTERDSDSGSDTGLNPGPAAVGVPNRKGRVRTLPGSAERDGVPEEFAEGSFRTRARSHQGHSGACSPIEVKRGVDESVEGASPGRGGSEEKDGEAPEEAGRWQLRKGGEGSLHKGGKQQALQYEPDSLKLSGKDEVEEEDIEEEEEVEEEEEDHSGEDVASGSGQMLDSESEVSLLSQEGDGFDGFVGIHGFEQLAGEGKEEEEGAGEEEEWSGEEEEGSGDEEEENGELGEGRGEDDAASGEEGGSGDEERGSGDEEQGSGDEDGAMRDVEGGSGIHPSTVTGEVMRSWRTKQTHGLNEGGDRQGDGVDVSPFHANGSCWAGDRRFQELDGRDAMEEDEEGEESIDEGEERDDSVDELEERDDSGYEGEEQDDSLDEEDEEEEEMREGNVGGAGGDDRDDDRGDDDEKEETGAGLHPGLSSAAVSDTTMLEEMAAMFPLGSCFWAGDPASLLAQEAWTSQRESLAADYKRKRRDALRQLPKRARR